MKKLIALVILVIVLITMGTLNFLPWWSFLVPVFLLGVLLPLQKWKVNTFLWGFIAGFIVWILSSAYFEIAYQGEIMQSITKIIGINSFWLRLAIGVIGGLLTGLGLYSGYLLRNGNEVLELELPGD
jgi:hypothetical protein